MPALLPGGVQQYEESIVQIVNIEGVKFALVRHYGLSLPINRSLPRRKSIAFVIFLSMLASVFRLALYANDLELQGRPEFIVYGLCFFIFVKRGYQFGVRLDRSVVRIEFDTHLYGCAYFLWRIFKHLGVDVYSRHSPLYFNQRLGIRQIIHLAPHRGSFLCLCQPITKMEASTFWRYRNVWVYSNNV